MGDTDDGSSGAAQRAQSDNVATTTTIAVPVLEPSETIGTPTRKAGFLTRLIATLSPTDGSARSSNDPAAGTFQI